MIALKYTMNFIRGCIFIQFLLSVILYKKQDRRNPPKVPPTNAAR